MAKPHRFTPEQLLEKIEEYIELKKSRGEPITFIGFADYIKMHRSSLNWMEKTEGYKPVLDYLRQACEADITERALLGKVNTTFAIFYLKVLHKWKDDEQKEPTPITIEFKKNDGKST